MDVSVIIPFANDNPHLYFTINQAGLLLVNSKLTHEIIVVANNCDEEGLAIEEANKLISARDFGEAHNARLLISDIPSNGTAANMGAKDAKGTYLCFMDSHVVLHPNLFTECIRVMEQDEKAGLVHPPISWTGVPHNPDFLFTANKRCYQYKYAEWDSKKHPGEWYLNQGGFTGTYSHFCKDANKAHVIAGCGHGIFMIRKSTWDKIGGYHTGQRAYGGRESFVTFKSWLFGYRNYTVPTTHHIHYNGRRLYQWQDGCGHKGNDVFWRNAMTQAYSIGGETWLDKTYAVYLKKPGVKLPILEKLRNEAIDWSKQERQFVLANQQFSFDDLLKLWDSVKLFY